jgi:DUF4097 and DUF4098 domain-containing protein YvlB
MNKTAHGGIRRACVLIAAVFLVVSCTNTERWRPMAKWERQSKLSAPLPAGSLFRARTRDGSISVEGAATDECRVVATIQTYAASKERAREMAEEIQVRLDPSDDSLSVVIEAPSSVNSANYSVSLNVVVPHRTALRLATGDGKVHVTNVEGSVEATTADGDVTIEKVTGDARLKSSDGSVACSQIEAGVLDLCAYDGSVRVSQAKITSCNAESSDGMVYLADVSAESLDVQTKDGGVRCQNVAAEKLDCHSSAGSVYITWAPDAPKAPDITVALADGHITFVAPPDLSVVVDAFSNSGPIRAKGLGEPKGRNDNSLHAVVGDGRGRLTLTTHDGSITIRDNPQL